MFMKYAIDKVVICLQAYNKMAMAMAKAMAFELIRPVLLSDVILGVKYMKAGYFEWGALTLMLCILPSVLTQLVSLRWHQVDQTTINLPIALSHFSLLGIAHR